MSEQNKSSETKPERFPDDSPSGPWGVGSVGMYWYVIHRETLKSKCVGTIGKPAMFIRAMEEASRRNALVPTPEPGLFPTALTVTTQDLPVLTEVLPNV